ncbi:hypothetical protein ElyMa_003209200 [Elysia marginata]|uniref:Uncharacterized protein n=1 Tax=Elysia marginata TaxID=1093978 RepID=A0AAV4J2X0_9GAST|nr:hypothetical protein ElyMa_003209200 [Elysia marginata]
MCTDYDLCLSYFLSPKLLEINPKVMWRNGQSSHHRINLEGELNERMNERTYDREGETADTVGRRQSDTASLCLARPLVTDGMLHQTLREVTGYD